MTIKYVHASDLSTEIYEPLNRWPPGYSLAVALVYFLTRDLVLSCVIVDIAGIILFFIVARKLLNILSFPRLISTVLLLFFACAIDPNISKPTDLLAMVAILYSIYLCLVLFNNPGKPSTFGILMGIANTLPLFLRYMYLPCIIIIPVVLIFLGVKTRRRRLTNTGWYSLCTSFILGSAIILFQKLYTGGSTYVFLQSHGFFPENLLKAFPVLIHSLLDTNFFLQQTGLLLNVEFFQLWNAATILNWAFGLVLLALFFIYLLRLKVAEFSVWSLFVVFSGVISLTIISVLTYLSLITDRTSKLFTSGNEWTFVADGRFYMFISFMFPVVSAHYFFNTEKPFLSSLKRLFKVVLVALVVIQVVHGIYFLVKRFAPFKLEGGNVLLTQDVSDYLISRLQREKNSGRYVAFTSHDETVSNWATMHGAAGLLHMSELESIPPASKYRTRLYLVVEESMVQSTSGLISQYNFALERTIGKVSIYSIEVK